MRKTDYLTCRSCGKRGWRTFEQADIALARIKCGHDRARRAGAAMKKMKAVQFRIDAGKRAERRVYRCEWSGLWHLTSQNLPDRGRPDRQRVD